MRKIVSYILIFFVLILTVITLLGIWDVIELEDVLRKIFLSLLVIFGASAVILFVYSVITKEQESFDQRFRQHHNPNPPSGN